MTDHIFYDILYSTKADFEEARKLLQRILRRDLYKIVAYRNLSTDLLYTKVYLSHCNTELESLVVVLYVLHCSNTEILAWISIRWHDMKYLMESTRAGFCLSFFHVILLVTIPSLLHPALLSRHMTALTGHHIIIISDPAFGWSLSEEVENWQ